MKRKSAWLLVMICVAVIGGALLIGHFASYANVAPQTDVETQPTASLDDITTSPLPSGLVTLRIDFRSRTGSQGKKKIQTDWDGSLKLSGGGKVRSIRAWQPDPRNQIEGTTWKLTTRHTIPWNSQQRKRGHKLMPLKDAALIIELEDLRPETSLEFETAQGDFEVALNDVPLGTRKGFFRGLVQVAQMASADIVVSAPTEDDYPSAALAADGTLHVAYVAFNHGTDFAARLQVPEPPEDYSMLAQPTGGDQILLVSLVDNQWTRPQPVTPPGQDVYRAAVSVDGSGDVWVVWSANRTGRWDIFARRLADGAWSPPTQISNDPGPDTFPVAVTDADGRIWIAWQGCREGDFNIFACQQEGDGFAEATEIATADGNQWAPAIAASADGQVAVAWDSYENGNYDVHSRVWSDAGWGQTVPVAASLKAEMRPSLTFDKQDRLWVAYEEAPEKWGKDQGALVKEGTGLYRGRTIAVRVLDEAKLFQPLDEPVNAFFPWIRQQGKGGRGSNLAVPRLATDAAGRVWLAVRSPRLGTRVGVGTVWFEHLTWYDGKQWSGEVICPKTDNILDNRPALVPQTDGRMLLVGSTDGRFGTGARLPQWFVRTLRQEGQEVKQQWVKPKWPDAVNNEIMMATMGPVPGDPAKAELKEVDLPEPATASPAAVKEAEDVARIRAARATVGGKAMQVVRGEFHRHTEISSDGGGDGLLMDMWRYGLDAAAMDWIGNGDHDNGGGRDYSWWITQKTTHLFQMPGAFTPMYSYERSCSYPDGHRNVVFDRRGIRTLPRLQNGKGKIMDDLPADAERPRTPDTQMLYRYLHFFDGVCASHTSGTDMGTDWRDNDAKVEPIVEIYQGCRQNYEMPGAPRSNTADNSLGGWRPLGFISLALKKGYRLGFQSSSDHGSTHISYCNVWVEKPTRANILAGMKARHIYGSTDNIIADVRCGDHFMGDEFTSKTRPNLTVHLVGTQPFAKVHIVKDNNYVHTIEPAKADVTFDWSDFDAQPGQTAYYYVRGEQTDGELVWVSPMWIKYEP